MAAAACERMEGFVLVLVVSKDQAQHPSDAVARVYRDYDVGSVDELAATVAEAGLAASRQVKLRAAMGAVIERCRARG